MERMVAVLINWSSEHAGRKDLRKDVPLTAKHERLLADNASNKQPNVFHYNEWMNSERKGKFHKACSPRLRWLFPRRAKPLESLGCEQFRLA